MSTQKQNEDVKNSSARIAVGDLNADADVRGGGGVKVSKKAWKARNALPSEDPGKDMTPKDPLAE